MNDKDQQDVIEENFYQILNVSETAPLEEITNAYRRLSRIFHPDKHSTHPNRKQWTESLFNKIKKAYEVISDPHKRAIYDTLGTHGLEVDGWEVVLRTRTPREIRDEYERLRQEREERRLQQGAIPRGIITLTVNATDLFMTSYDEYDMIEVSHLIPIIELSGMNIQQSIEVPVSYKNSLTISGNISAQNGLGTGGIVISNRHVSSERGWIDTQFGIGNGPLLGFKVFRTISKFVMVNCGSILRFTPKGLSPSFVSSVALQLNGHSVGYLTYRAGSQGSSMSAIYVWNTEKLYASTALQIGTPNSFISSNIIWRVPQYDINLKFALKMGTIGIMAEYGAEKKVSPSSTISASVGVGVPSGVMLKIKWTCTSQTIVVPIQLSDELVPAPVFYATVVPIVSWLLLKKFMIDPISNERKERERQRIVEANYDRLLEMQQQALAAVELMRETSDRIRSEEEKKKGLVIMKALYGKLPADSSSHVIVEPVGDGIPPGLSISTQVIDVTIPLQCLIKESKLKLFNASKSQLPGFYDPCLGEDKHLTIQYMFLENLYCCTVADNEAVNIPQNDHVILS